MAFGRGTLVTSTGLTNFAYQTTTESLECDKEEAMDSTGNVKQVDFFNQRAKVSITALFPTGSLPTLTPGTTLDLTGGVNGGTGKFYIESSKVNAPNKSHQTVDIELVRYVTNSLPAST